MQSKKTQTVKRGNYRKHSTETKAEVLAAVEATGNVSKVAQETGISEKTIHNWVKGIGINDANFERIKNIKKGEIRDLFKFITVRALGRLGEKLETASLCDLKISELATVAAISTDKMQLLEGEPTTIITQKPRDKKTLYESYIEHKLRQAQEAGEELTREQVIEKMKTFRPDVEQVLEIHGEQ